MANHNLDSTKFDPASDHGSIARENICKDDVSLMEKTGASFRQYACFQRTARIGANHRISKLSEADRAVLPHALISGSDAFKEREKLMVEAEIRNQFFFDNVLMSMGMEHSQDPAAAGEEVVPDDTAGKVRSVLKSVAREWTAEGAREREECYGPIMAGLKEYVDRGRRVLVPGAGLGRLALDIYLQGYECCGNEFTFHMLFLSDFILNHCGTEPPGLSFQISPWLGAKINVNKIDDLTRTTTVPDIDPRRTLESQAEEVKALNLDFSMVAGEFCEMYGQSKEEGRWDAVASCFFLDTAPSIAEYLRVIHRCLSTGGVLVNFGPLLYHWSGPSLRPSQSIDMYYKKSGHLDPRYMSSVDLCWDDVRQILINVGFEILEEQMGLHATYTNDRKSFMNTQYNCVYFVARKK
uniref:carnosine N-methyltransferase n=1 Tax=Corethron hystrix TaxID=216773 RepID=A0A6U5L7I1_9STRA|mmetsp:Transcript_43304/g.101552  ORF Transcript_43304/g.101552 Transcript_43304/m.101552 type:complete len:409 (-) Transcript_43304:189-1415(-)|eukprot:CAMPEP_0113316194 /NCGR_PEP_ID=MMETSP0010_2-20120614/11555_1 /TAXON_ID=216773 ORGANISM="Corethron hystrix, Strain 308" /NCGR_SAMPLE_ID=MMETSP0010_2 /ASSEMBLY_ACC=CAM_ASM_000155 /LENGTH=408 /DNA_ID=CAMNT_0000172837 /DNA_START=65 /DNA_END=1291 /DNA_ORIENTATION=+ /assembly_acc=CAM_ASM_000155